ncbi:hypothetical protein GF327_06635 [Candidatus Woesearchaeota archaeon]|nr:hypothetical protein [Candidatus Woesearchaeota archaeon]
MDQKIEKKYQSLLLDILTREKGVVSATNVLLTLEIPFSDIMKLDRGKEITVRYPMKESDNDKVTRIKLKKLDSDSSGPEH